MSNFALSRENIPRKCLTSNKQSSFWKACTDEIPQVPSLLPPMLVACIWGICGRAKHMSILFSLKPSCHCVASVFLYIKHPLCIWRLGERGLPVCTWNLQLSASAPVGLGIWNIFVFPGHSWSSEIWPLEGRGLLQAWSSFFLNRVCTAKVRHPCLLKARGMCLEAKSRRNS